MKRNAPRIKLSNQPGYWLLTIDLLYKENGIEQWQEYSARFEQEPTSDEVVERMNELINQLWKDHT